MTMRRSCYEAAARHPAARRNCWKNRTSRPIQWLLAVMLCGSLTSIGCSGKTEADSEYRMAVRQICERSFPECRVEFSGAGNGEIYGDDDTPAGMVRFSETAQDPREENSRTPFVTSCGRICPVRKKYGSPYRAFFPSRTGFQDAFPPTSFKTSRFFPG